MLCFDGGYVETDDAANKRTQATVKASSPTGNLLQGRTLAIKDNVAVAGVRCTNGTTMVDWTPDYDATIVTRILDAGGLILGKSGKRMCVYAIAQ